MMIRATSPFFSVLLLFAEFRATRSVPTAATDGRTIVYNPEFLLSLPREQVHAVLLHEALHAALLHSVRRGTRDAQRWNIAADVVVNGIVAQQPRCTLTPGAIRAPKLEHLRVEEIYEMLDQEAALLEYHPDCLIEGDASGKSGEGEQGSGLRRLLEMEEHWKRALRQAEAVARSSQGSMPAGIDRLLEQLGQSEIDWRAQLWRFLVRTPTDFAGFDRRMLHRRLYLEALESESVRVAVALDTSGSIDHRQLALFMSEVRGILRAYPHLEGELFYADAEVYGPRSIHEEVDRPRPAGGGGTSFVPFFERIEQDDALREGGVAIYLTDGYGTFPSSPPSVPVLWVVTPGGLDSASFPFGEVARLLAEG
ncbi:MAG: hypothetical protein EOO75_05190 [Myxococcales bacterium]|nr:MAG: hypothetical protein EOO75_05190 [Myxococcales bacterium]